MVTIVCRIEIRKMAECQPVTSCLTNHSELCMSRPHNNQSRRNGRISIYTLQRPPSFGFESSVSSTSMTSGDPVAETMRGRLTDVITRDHVTKRATRQRPVRATSDRERTAHSTAPSDSRSASCPATASATSGSDKYVNVSLTISA